MQSNFNVKPFQKKVTIYKNLVQPIGAMTLDAIINVIKSDRFKQQQDYIQYWFANGDAQQGEAEKKKLLSFSASCQCSLWRRLENVTHYTSFLIFDVDDLQPDELLRVWKLILQCPYVLAAFRSPSYRGLKFIIETDSPMQDHKQAFDKAAKFFETSFAIHIDRSGSDVCRVCFIGHDPDAFYNLTHETFCIPAGSFLAKRKYKTPEYRPAVKGTEEYVFQKCVRSLNRQQQFVEGNRNNYIFLLSCYCRLNGLSQPMAEQFILNHFSYSESEIKISVKSAYKYK